MTKILSSSWTNSTIAYLPSEPGTPETFKAEDDDTILEDRILE